MKGEYEALNKIANGKEILLMLKKMGRLDELESVMSRKVESADEVVRQVVK